MELETTEYLVHYGIIRRSGRYPWGSGGNNEGSTYVTENNRTFLDYVKSLFKKGMTESQIAEGFGMSTTQLRAARTLAKSEQRASDISMIERLKEKGMSNTAIGERIGMPEATVRSLLKPSAKLSSDSIQLSVDALKAQVDEKGYLDVGVGTENLLNISKERLNVSLEILRADGYQVYSNIKAPRLNTAFDTRLKVLTTPDKTFIDVIKNKDKISQVNERLNDTGETLLGIEKPLALNLKRVDIVYGPDGGALNDGVMYVRPGVDDVNLGGSSYAQVRIQVGAGHYIKGMAIYKDGLPDGVDVQFNTNKKDTGNKLDSLKELTRDDKGAVDKDNPFGTVISRQIGTELPNGRVKVTSVVNIVNEAGDWSNWSDTIASQVLSKQPPKLAKEQLDMTYEARKNQLDEIMTLTNPTVKRKMLEDFASDVDAAAVHLKASKLPRQSWHAILPVNSLKDTEIYAPNYNDGERVALIRYPHGGTFEIPELTVNNKNREAKKYLDNARDAVGINSKVAERLSGADFDGDTVLVVPNNSGKLKSTPALEGLKNFNPREQYRGFKGMPVMKNTGAEMGSISNLITDMTIAGASRDELVRAVRHSMVVIDAEKHALNYKESAKVNAIKQLKAKYQPTGGSSTIISRAQSPRYQEKMKARPMSEGGPINKKTGELEFVPAGQTNYKTGQPKQERKALLEVTRDAREITSGKDRRIENLYADHSNRLKSMANAARLEAINTPRSNWSPSAKKTYSKEVKELNSALALAKSNAPRERRAQNIAEATYKAKLESSVEMQTNIALQKKVKHQALAAARNRTGASKEKIVITAKHWEAIQAGAISDSNLKQILTNSDMDSVKEFARPKSSKTMTSSKTRRAEAMLAQGYTRADISKQLGVPLGTLDEALY